MGHLMLMTEPLPTEKPDRKRREELSNEQREAIRSSTARYFADPVWVEQWQESLKRGNANSWARKALAQRRREVDGRS